MSTFREYSVRAQLTARPVSRSITVPRKPAATFRAAAGRGYVRKTRTEICTVMGGLLQPFSS